MTNRNNYKDTTYTVAIEVSKSPTEVFNFITNLSQWWVEEFEGEDLKPNSEFILKMGENHFSKNKVLEFVPNKKFVWVTTESIRTSDNFDWTGTKMIFELSQTNKGTLITFTYDGVVLESDRDKLKEICDYCIKDLLYKRLESFTVSIEVSKSTDKAFNAIKDVGGWWATNVCGNTTGINDVFTVRFGKTFATIKNIEIITNKKIIWQVLDSLVPLFQNERQWNNTRMLWEISQDEGKTKITFTHLGLTPDTECYADCVMGWSFFIKESLLKLITDNKGLPRTGITAFILCGERKYDGLLYYKEDPLPDYTDEHIFLDVKETRGEQIESIYSSGIYQKGNFDVRKLEGEYFVIIENKSSYGNITPFQDISRLSEIKKNSYTSTIEIANSPEEVFNCIAAVTMWWSKDFEGSSSQLNDEFIIHHPNQHYSKQKLIEVIPNRKIVWLVTESKLYWLQNNKEEWTNTKMIFEISTQYDRTTLHFTHYGLVPELECYTMCEKGWTMIIKSWLSHFITYGTEAAEMTKAAEIRSKILADKTN